MVSQITTELSPTSFLSTAPDYVTDVTIDTITMATDDNVQSFDIADPSIYYTLCALVLVTGFLGNATVIICWLRDNNAYKCRAYIIGLATIDLLACFVVCPLLPLVSPLVVGPVDYNGMFFLIVYACFLFTILAYLTLLTATAMDRAVAVCKPHAYIRLQRKQTPICAALLCFCACMDALCFLLDSTFRMRLALALFLIAFLIIAASYTTMAVKLCKLHQSIKPAPTRDAWTTSQITSSASGSNATKKKNAWLQNKSLIGTIKAFASITVCFILSLTLYVVHYAWLDLPWYFLYMYFVNHVSTPVIHFITHKQFRKDIKAAFKSINTM